MTPNCLGGCLLLLATCGLSPTTAAVAKMIRSESTVINQDGEVESVNIDYNMQDVVADNLEGGIKLIVNSDVRYSIALETLLQSLEDVSFLRWPDVIVMRGSACEDSEPYKPNTMFGKRGVTYVDLKLSSRDLHGFSGLYHHRNDPLVKAKVYMYIHDTVKANSTFPSMFDSMASIGPDEVRHPPFPFSNICAFGSGVVESYGVQFDKAVTKAAGIQIEFGGGSDGVQNVVHFGKTDVVVEDRQQIGQEDPYHTGLLRQALYYPAFGLTKYLLYNREGDLLGHVTDTYR